MRLRATWNALVSTASSAKAETPRATEGNGRSDYHLEKQQARFLTEPDLFFCAPV